MTIKKPCRWRGFFCLFRLSPSAALMATTPDDPTHILKAKQAAAEQGLDLAPAFTALNLAAQFYRESQAASPAAPEKDETTKLRYILKNVRKRLRQLHEILAADDTADAKKVKKIRFVVNLLLPPPEQPPQSEKAST